MILYNFVVVRCEKGDIICKDMEDAHMLIECYEIRYSRIEEYDSGFLRTVSVNPLLEALEAVPL